MLSYTLLWIFLGNFFLARTETVSSVPIRILDSAEKSSNLRPVIYGENRNRESSYSDYYPRNHYNNRDRPYNDRNNNHPNHYLDRDHGFNNRDHGFNNRDHAFNDRNQGAGPYGSYVIYDDGPRKVFHRWNFNGNNWNRVPHYPEPTRKAEWINNQYDSFPFYKKDNYDLSKPKPTLSYQSVYSNIVKVYEDPPQDFYNNPGKKYTGETKSNYLKYGEPPVRPDYEVHYPYPDGKKYYNDQKLPDNFPKIFSPNRGFRFTVSEAKPLKQIPPKTFYADAGYYRTYTVNYAPQNESRSFNTPDRDRKRSSCNLIRLGSSSFPPNELCSRSEGVTLEDYPDYSKFSNEDIPMEHRRQNYFKANEVKARGKRSAYGYGYGFDSWNKGSYSPYDRNFNDYYYSSYYPNYDSYDNNLDGNYYRTGGYYRNRGYDRDRGGFGYNNNRYNSGGRYNSDDYNNEYRNSEETTTRGLTAFLSSGGRRDKSRNGNRDEEDEEEEDSEEFRGRRRDQFNNNNNNNREENENRNRQNGSKRRPSTDSSEDGEEDRSNQGNYGRNGMNGRRDNRNRYNYRNNDNNNYRYNNNRNRGSYGSGSGSYGGHNQSNGNYGSGYGNSYNSNRNNGYGSDMDRESRPFGLYG